MGIPRFLGAIFIVGLRYPAALFSSFPSPHSATSLKSMRVAGRIGFRVTFPLHSVTRTSRDARRRHARWSLFTCCWLCWSDFSDVCRGRNDETLYISRRLMLVDDDSSSFLFFNC